MFTQRRRRLWGVLGAAVALVAGTVSAQVLPGGGFPGGGFPGGGFPGGGPGGFPGGGPGGFPGGGPGGFPGGGSGRFQGGGFPGGGTFSMNGGGQTRLAAFCTDLFGDPPTDATLYASATGGSVTFADGSRFTLGDALRRGLAGLTGKSPSFEALRTGGSLLLDLRLVNRTPVPMRVEIPAGTVVTPAGQAGQALPAGAGPVLEAAARRRWTHTNTVQLAMWALGGRTAEDVEQTHMAPVPEKELEKVQALLGEGGQTLRFDRDRGTYARRFSAELAGLKDASPVTGTAPLVTGSARISGAATSEGKGLVKVEPKTGGEYFYRADVSRSRGKLIVRLRHLVTGRPLASAKELVVTPRPVETAGG